MCTSKALVITKALNTSVIPDSWKVSSPQAGHIKLFIALPLSDHPLHVMTW